MGASSGFANDDGSQRKVHIRWQQRNRQKSLTIVEGMPESVRLPKSGRSLAVDFQKILKAIKNEFNTNGSVCRDKDHGRIMQVNGDKRKDVANFLVDVTALVTKEQIVIHGS